MSQSAARTLKELQIIKAEQQKIIDEIVVKAKRVKPPIGLVRAFAGPALFAADVSARIVDQISRQRLDEIGRIATLTDPPKPDTPVRTIKPETIPEIIVTAKRPTRRPISPLPGRIDISRDPLGDPRVGLVRPTIPAISPVKVPKPTIPGKTKRPKSPLLAFPDMGLTPVSPPRSRPATIPRSRLLNIGGTPNPAITPGLTGSNVAGVPSLQTAPVRVRANTCGPCPKPKRDKDKKRTKCYKKLVEERRTSSRDKVFKWTRIDCDTGRELRTK